MTTEDTARAGSATSIPAWARDHRALPPVICYPPETLTAPDMALYTNARETAQKTAEVVVPPREARCIEVPAGHFFRISSIEGSQVGDLNLHHLHDVSERFWSGKTRALHGTHLTTGRQLWSSIPHMRAMATITTDTLDWYGIDEHGGSVHDVIGTRCDPYTHHALSGDQYHHCCHSNLTRSLAEYMHVPLAQAELFVHDVMNVFMCTGFTRDTGQYFMKASPVRPGDHIEFLAEIDLLANLSSCPGGDCSTSHSSDAAQCHPLMVEVFAPDSSTMSKWTAAGPNGYDRTHNSPG